MNELSQMNVMLFYMNALIIAMIGVMLAILPYITRKALLFGVRVPESAHSLPEVTRMKRFYSVTMAVAALLTLAGTLYINQIRPDWNLLISLYAPFVLLLVQLVVFICLWKKSLALKEQAGWVIPAVSTAETRSARSREHFGGLPWIWYIGSLFLIVVAALASLAVYPSLPDIIVTHWNGAMEADAWAAKSLIYVFIMPIIALVMLLIMLGSNLIVYRMKLQVSQENPTLSYAQHRVYRRWLSHMLGFVTVCMTLMMLVMQPMILNLWIPDTAELMLLILIPTTLMVLPAIFLSVKAGQGGTKLRPAITDADVAAAGYPLPDDRQSQKRYSDDRFWKLGMFYYNPEDPALFVEDRFGNNGGLNYARPAALIIAVLLVLLILVTYAGSTVLFLSII